DNAWGEAYYDTGNFNKGLFVSGHNITQVIANTVTQGGLGGEWERNVLDIYYNGGNVGIGTTDPDYPLEVKTSLDSWASRIYNAGSSASSAGLLVRSDATAANKAFVFGAYADNEYKFLVRSDGNVGIGTTNPGTSLEINKALNQSAPIITLSRGGVSKSRFAIANATDSILAGAVTDDLCIRTEGGNIRFGTASATKTDMSILSNGNVGIGAADPNDKVHIKGDSSDNDGDVCLRIHNPNAGDGTTSSIRFTNTTTLFDHGAITVTREGSLNNLGSMKFFTNQNHDSGNPAMTINPLSNVGIGVTNPGAKLHIQGDDDEIYNAADRLQRNGATLFVYNTSEDNNSYSQLVLGNRQSSGSMSRIVSVLLQQGQSELSFSTTKGTVQQESMAISSDGVKVNNLTASSDVMTNASSYLTTSSDKRLKNDLGDCEYGLNEVLQVQPKRYTWKDGPKDANPTVGFFAQDVHDVMPEAAPREAIQNEKGEDDYKWGFHSQTIIAALVNATKEQQQLIEDLRSEVEALKNK
ncbi:tail fiber domain-containing protein, partial [bacterium]|nr:tail fiber domain-containing protein [bacterium]